MKGTLRAILLAEAAACVVFAVLGRVFAAAFTALFAFPFEQVAAGLRALSLAGSAGNICALILYGALCLLPAGYGLWRAIKRRAQPEDLLLALLSILLFLILYWLINPAHIAARFGAEAAMLDAGRSFLGITLYSVIAGYIVLRALRAFSKGEAGMKYMRILLAAAAMALVFGMFALNLTALFSAFDAFIQGNTVTDVWGTAGPAFGMSHIFLVLQYLVGVLPHAFGIAVIFSGLDLLGALEENPYGGGIIACARKMGRLCRRAVAAIMLSQVAMNVAQLALGPLLHSSSYTLTIPLLSVGFVLGAVLLAGYFEQAKRIKDDSDMII